MKLAIQWLWQTMEHKDECPSSKVLASPALCLQITISMTQEFATDTVILRCKVLSIELSPNGAITFLNPDQKVLCSFFEKTPFFKN